MGNWKKNSRINVIKTFQQVGGNECSGEMTKKILE